MTKAASQVDLAIFTHDLQCGGAEKVCVLLANAFARRGLSVDLVVRRKVGVLVGDLETGVRLVDLGAPRVRHALVPLVGYLARERPRRLLAALWPLTSIAVWAALLARVDTRVVVSDHTILSNTRPGLSRPGRALMSLAMRASYRWAAGAVAVSATVAADVARLAGLAPESISTISNPVDEPDTGAQADPEVLARWSRDAPRLISVGNLKTVKDHDTLLRAFARLRQRHPCGLLVLGEGPLRGRLEALASDLGLAGAVTFAGHAACPAAYLRHADLFVLSSRSEGFGISLVEALSCGVPVVSTDCGGPREILDGGRFGRLTPVGDHARLADAVAEALADTVDPGMLRARAACYGADRALDAYARVLDLGGPAARP